LVNHNGLRENELQTVVDKLKYDRELISKLLIQLGDLQVKNHKYKAASSTYQRWLQDFSDFKGKKDVVNKLKMAQKEKDQHKTILLMVPLTGINMDVGKSLLEGMLLVLDGVIRQRQGKIQYQVIDTEGDPLLAVKRMRKAIKSNDVIGIIGPAMSDVSLAIAIELSSKKSRIPMISPTATTHGISTLGEGIFQINVSTAVLGQVIAQYAMKCMDLKEFAILAPNTEYGVDLSRAFESNTLAHGGTIIAKEYYDPEAKDYVGHFKVIRHRKAKAYLAKKWIRRGRSPSDIPKKNLKSWAADSLLRIDALFIPAASSDEAFKLASQVRYHKLQTKILGSSGWYDKAIIPKGHRYVRGTIFSINFYLDKNSQRWKDYNKKYKARWGAEPDKISILGYDAALFLAQGLKMGNEYNLITSLKKIRVLKGMQGNIEIDPQGGFNRTTALAKIGKKEFEKLDFCKEK
jgi:ABC-type branched-subunit amino acid transport system substrate-binding protein